MKRRLLLQHLANQKCEVLREGANHTLVISTETRRVSTVPRHREIDESLVRKICKDLDVVTPWGR